MAPPTQPPKFQGGSILLIWILLLDMSVMEGWLTLAAVQPSADPWCQAGRPVGWKFRGTGDGRRSIDVPWGPNRFLLNEFVWSQPNARQVEGHTHLAPSIRIVSICLQKCRDWKENYSQQFLVFRSHFSIECSAEIAGSHQFFEWLAPKAKVTCQHQTQKWSILA